MLAQIYTFQAIDTLRPVYPALNLPINFIGFFTGSAVPLLFYAFPNGRFVPRFTRWLALAWIVLMFSDNFLMGTRWHISNFGWLEPFFGLFFVTFAAAQLYRYRYVASGVERQQTKWVVFGFLVGVAMMMFFNVLLILEPPELRGGSLLSLAKELGDSFFAFLLTVSLGVAILRYRLWEIDVLIRRTLVYTTLVTVLLFIYFGSVVLLQSFFRTLTGQDSDLAIALSTLMIAALFAPLLRRVRTFIDQRFYRRKYDAARTVAAFAATLRYEVELDNLTRGAARAKRILWLPAISPSGCAIRKIHRRSRSIPESKVCRKFIPFVTISGRSRAKLGRVCKLQPHENGGDLPHGKIVG